MEQLKNEFSWSISRYKSFLECKRKFFYSYYGSWGGWEQNAPEDVRTAYILNKLKNRYMWAGEVVHSVIENMLKKYYHEGNLPDDQKIFRNTRDQMEAQFLSSKGRNYWMNPKSLALHEHEYEINLEPDKWQDIYNSVESCLKNFFTSNFYRSLPELKECRWLPIEKFEYFNLGGYKINVKLDFAYFKDNLLTIIDWKTGRSDYEDKNQLSCYGLYAREKWGQLPERVNTIEYNLYTQTAKKRILSHKALEDVQNYIHCGIENIKNYLDDVENNIAKIEKFPKILDERICRSCNFFKICKG